MSLNKLSIHTVLAAITILIISFVMITQGIYIYISEKEKLELNILEDIETSAHQLQNSTRPYIESYAPNEYVHLINNEMRHKNILAILVSDYNMAQILGQKEYISGSIKDENWKVIDYELKSNIHNQILQTKSHEIKKDILDQQSGKIIGTVTIYGSDKISTQQLNTFFIRNIAIAFSIYVSILLALFLAVHYLVLKPFKKIVISISNTDKDGIPVKTIKQTGIKEISFLISKINNMISSVQDSRDTLQEQKDEFQVIFDNSKDGIAIMDLESNFLNCNNAYLEMTGYTLDELLKSSCLELTVPADRESAINALQQVILKGHLENLEKRCILKDGSEINVNMSITLLPDKKRILGSTKDVTQLKLVESQSKLASMGEMIGNIAHQWRQPLSVISTSASGAKLQKEMGILKDEQFIEHMDRIVDQSQYLSQTIDDFRDFIKADARDEATISVVEVIKKALTLIDSSLKNNYIKLITTLDDDIKIKGFENELVQALINIINNAKDALKEKGDLLDTKLIFVETKLTSNSLVLLIKDNAGGIPADIISRVFEPYFTTKHQSVGTGIGLSMARNIITEHHGASIEVDNERFTYNSTQYIGACFKIIFKFD